MPFIFFQFCEKALPFERQVCGCQRQTQVDSRQVEVHQAYYQVVRAETVAKRKEAEQELETVLARRHATDVMFATIASAACETAKCSSEEVLEGPIETWNMACHKASLELVVEHCGSFTD